MAEDEDVEITGVDEVLKQFKLIETGFLNAIEEAVLKATKLVEADAKRIVPVVTGRLARSITGGISEKSNTVVVGVVGANTVYAAAVEFGRNTKGGRSKPKPYLNPALSMNMSRIEKMISDALKKTIRDFDEKEA